MKNLYIFLVLLLFISCGEKDSNAQNNEDLKSNPTSNEEAPVEEEPVEETPSEEPSEEAPVEKTSEELKEEAEALMNQATQEKEKADALMNQATQEKEKADALMKQAKEYNSAERLTQFKNRISFWGNILAILTIAGLGFALYYIYGWRKYVENGNVLMLPEQFYKIREEQMDERLSITDERLSNTTEKTNSFFQKMGMHIKQISDKNQDDYNEMLRQLTLLLDQVEEQKQINEDLREGYHNNILENFVRRILDIRSRFAYYVEDNNTSEEIKKIISKELDKLDTLLEGEGVHKIILKKGDSIKGSDGKYLNTIEMTEGIETEDRDLQGTVIETLEIGFCLKLSDGTNKIIEPAQIKFYSEGESVEETPAEEPVEETPVQETPVEEELIEKSSTEEESVEEPTSVKPSTDEKETRGE